MYISRSRFYAKWDTTFRIGIQHWTQSIAWLRCCSRIGQMFIESLSWPYLGVSERNCAADQWHKQNINWSRTNVMHRWMSLDRTESHQRFHFEVNSIASLTPNKPHTISGIHRNSIFNRSKLLLQSPFFGNHQFDGNKPRPVSRFARSRFLVNYYKTHIEFICWIEQILFLFFTQNGPFCIRVFVRVSMRTKWKTRRKSKEKSKKKWKQKI